MNRFITDLTAASELLNGWQPYLDDRVHREVLSFHARSNWIIDSSLKPWQWDGGLEYATRAAEFSQSRFSPAYPDWIPVAGDSDGDPGDRGSCRRFADRSVDKQKTCRILGEALAAYSEGPRQWHRPFPSAGALYPVEVVVLWEDPEHLRRSVWHLLPNSRGIGSWPVEVDDPYASLHLPAAIGHPPLVLSYWIQLSKVLFKYRYRGYRHALMEAGSMYQRVKQVTDRMGLDNCCWSGYCDDQLCRSLQVDPQWMVPVMAQLIGYGEKVPDGA